MIIGIVVLLLFTMSWYLLALLPALRELVLKTDANPLVVHADYSGEATHFAKSSLEFISANFPGRLLKQHAGRIEGLLDNGNPYTLIPYADHEVEIDRYELASHSVDRVLISYAPLRLPDQTAALATIYSARDLKGGAGTAYRALFGDSNIDLRERSIVLRWVHAEGRLDVGHESSLFGRASAGRGIRIMPGSKFQRLSAPRIEFGDTREVSNPINSPLTPASVPHLPEMMVPRHVVKGSVVLPPNSFVGHDIVSSGSIRVGRGSWIAGSLKAADDVLVDGESRIDGSVVAERDVFIGGGCYVRGPVIAERNVLIDGPTAVGSPGGPTTLTAPSIYFSEGVVVFGSVWARESGSVEAAPVANQPALESVA
jgi:hypothetical protein